MSPESHHVRNRGHRHARAPANCPYPPLKRLDTSIPRRHLLQLLGAAALASQVPLTRAQEPVGRIGTIGAGSIGTTLGALWIKAGKEVMFSSRDPAELVTLANSLGPLAHAGTVARAIAFGDVVLMAVSYDLYPRIGREFGPALAGKVVIDAGNATRSVLFDETRRQGIGITTARYLPGARIVRAFNAANSRVFAHEAGRSPPRMAVPIAGDDAEALAMVASLVDAAGFDPLVVGGLKDADRFAMGTDGFGHVLPVDALAARLGVSRH